tara:strand:- start:9 stop:1031 length:1023 start_codon:yes stop_codon:yes gene_type:complete
MAVPSSGQISLAGIAAEVGVKEDYSNAGTVQASLATLAEETTFNSNSSSTPNSSQPHAMSEWYGYDHDAAAAFTDNNAVAKSITTGSGQAITILETSAYSLTEQNAYSIGFWIKAGWTNNLNTNLHFFAMNDGSSTAANDQIRIFYNESNNRLEFRIGSNSTNRSFNFWALHSSLTQTGLPGSSASNYWSSSNRGNVNGNNYTHLVITKGTGTTLAASNIAAYWNGTKLNNAFYSNGNNAGTVEMTEDARRICLGSNAHTFAKSGDTNETKYNVLTIYNKQLSDSEVTTLYNSGTPASTTTASGIGNLQGYYNFESDGSDTSANNNDGFTISGNSNIEAK